MVLPALACHNSMIPQLVLSRENDIYNSSKPKKEQSQVLENKKTSGNNNNKKIYWRKINEMQSWFFDKINNIKVRHKFMPVILVPRRLRQKSHEFEASLGCTAIPWLKNNRLPNCRSNVTSCFRPQCHTFPGTMNSIPS